jgi:ethanolamine ammonia-lyase small subunit
MDRNEDAERIRRLFHGQTLKASIQIVVSDGLNADAVNENLRNVLPALRDA